MGIVTIVATNGCLIMGPQEMANTAWAFAKLEYEHHRIMKALSKAAIRTLSVFS